MSTDPLPEPSPEPVDFVAGAPTSYGPMDVHRCHGASAGSGNSEPKIQVHRYDEHTLVLRRAKTVTYEAPFLTSCSPTLARCCSIPARPPNGPDVRCAKRLIS